MRTQKLDCVKFENGYILLIDVISFKLSLINFVYFSFETPCRLPSFSMLILHILANTEDVPC